MLKAVAILAPSTIALFAVVVPMILGGPASLAYAAVAIFSLAVAPAMAYTLYCSTQASAKEDELIAVRRKKRGLAEEKRESMEKYEKAVSEKSEKEIVDRAEEIKSHSSLGAEAFCKFLLGKIIEGEPNDLNYFRLCAELVADKKILDATMPQLFEKATRARDVALLATLISISNGDVELPKKAKDYLMSFVERVSEKSEVRKDKDDIYSCAVLFSLIEYPFVIETGATKARQYYDAKAIEKITRSDKGFYNPITGEDDGVPIYPEDDYVDEIEFLNAVKDNPLAIFKQLVAAENVELVGKFLQNVKHLLDMEDEVLQGVEQTIAKKEGPDGRVQVLSASASTSAYVEKGNVPGG